MHAVTADGVEQLERCSRPPVDDCRPRFTDERRFAHRKKVVTVRVVIRRLTPGLCCSTRRRRGRGLDSAYGCSGDRPRRRSEHVIARVPGRVVACLGGDIPREGFSRRDTRSVVRRACVGRCLHVSTARADVRTIVRQPAYDEHPDAARQHAPRERSCQEQLPRRHAGHRNPSECLRRGRSCRQGARGHRCGRSRTDQRQRRSESDLLPDSRLLCRARSVSPCRVEQVLHQLLGVRGVHRVLRWWRRAPSSSSGDVGHATSTGPEGLSRGTLSRCASSRSALSNSSRATRRRE